MADLPGTVPLESAQSWLFVPGDRPERFAKAAASGAHVVICDLEDAVAPEAKDAARTQVARHLNGGGAAVVRINAPGTAWFEADLDAVASARGLLGLMLPKAEDGAAVEALAARVARPVVGLVETALGISRAADLAARCARLAFGSLDFAVDIDADHDDDGALLLARSTLVLASRAAGLPAPIDGVTTALDNPSITEAAARRARALGFGGKLCIHPTQVDAVHAALRPTPEQGAWARGVIAAHGGGSAGAVRSPGGELIDAPVLARARAILDRESG